jgi:sugar phosphate isomerase/epimerase
MRAFRGTRALLALVLSTLLVVAAATAASAWPGHGHGHGHGHDKGIPKSKISVQLWTFSSYIGFGEEPENQQRLEETLAGLSEIGYRNVEPFSFNGLTAKEFKALLRKYDLRAPSRHGDTTEATWDQHLDDAWVLRQRYTGSGGFAAPGIDSYEDTLATAETMNRLGKRSVRNGTGPIFGHNHQGEFRTMYPDPETGEMKSAWQIILENTKRRYVKFQLDVLWATDGGADPVELLKRYPKRIKLLHIKDGTGVADPVDATPVPMGEGEMEFKPILRAAKKANVRYYVYEQDPPDDPTFDPFASAEAGWDYLSTVRP